MQKRALITGLNGFTGRYLTSELKAAGYRVFGTAHVNEQVGEDMLAVDLCDREELRRVVAEVRPDVVAHLAAISFVAHGDAEAIYRTNVVGTRNLLEALAVLPEPQEAPVIICVFNNYYLGMVRQMQQLFYGKRYEATCLRRRAKDGGYWSGPPRDL